MSRKRFFHFETKIEALIATDECDIRLDWSLSCQIESNINFNRAMIREF